MYSSVKSINITYLILELVLDLPRARASNRPGSFPPAIKQLLTYMSRYGIPTEQINDIILKSFNKQHGVLQVPFPQFMSLPTWAPLHQHPQNTNTTSTTTTTN